MTYRYVNQNGEMVRMSVPQYRAHLLTQARDERMKTWQGQIRTGSGIATTTNPGGPIGPGIYRLAVDVKNPRANRQKVTDWRCFHTWWAGLELIVSNESEYQDKSLMYIRPVGSRWPHSLSSNSTRQYSALVAAMVKVDESPAALFASLEVDDGFSRWLVESGRVSVQLFRKLWDEYQNDGTEDDPNSLKPTTVKLVESDGAK